MQLNFKITSVTQVLENDISLTQALFFDEILRFETNITRAEGALVNCVKYTLSELALVDIHRRHSPTVKAKEVSFSLEPLKDSIGWKEPLTLAFQTLEWTIDDMDLVYVPVLGIEILNREKDRESLEKKVISEIKAELLRRKSASSLKELLYLQRCQSIKTNEISFLVDISTPKQIALKLHKPEEKASVLEDIGVFLNAEPLPVAYEVEEETKLLADALTGRAARSVLLVGDSGVGKTAIFYNLVKNRSEYDLLTTPFWATSGSKLVAGMSGFGMWQERCQLVWKEATKEKAILFFANLVELMHVGKSTHNSQGIASFFRPYLVRGDLIAVAECTPEQLPLIEKEDPHLLDAFQQIRISPPDLQKGRSILQNFALNARHKRSISLIGLEMLDQLHRRYATYSAYPGRPLRFLKNLISDLNHSEEVTEKEVIKAFSLETGLPLFILDDETKLDLSLTEEWFSKRVIGQNEAVHLVVDMLAMIKARLARTSKPIASFLFIGPTGVGKTEMAKALAEFLFQNKARLSRFDMSEFSDSFSVKRLIGGVFGAEGLLTAKVRDQPFSVILFDEFEKADPLFFDLLLQVLGEGRLTDSAGKLADFRNAVVIMTSNLGAEAFQKGALGFQNEDLANATKHFTSAVKDFLRPELFNRIDRIVPFTPLPPEVIHKIASRELENLAHRDGVKYRNLTMNYSSDVITYLAETGYSPRYGARPLKRAIERELLVPVSEKLNLQTHQANTQYVLEVGLNKQSNLEISLTQKLDKQGRAITSSQTNTSNLMSLIKDFFKVSQDAYKLEHSSEVMDIQNEIFRLSKLEQRLERPNKMVNKWKNPQFLKQVEKLEKLPKLQKVFDTCKNFTKRTTDTEDNLMLAFYNKHELDYQATLKEINSLSKEWQDILLSVYALKFSKPNYITLAFYSENQETLFETAYNYFSIALKQEAKIEVVKLTIDKEKTKEAKDKSKKNETQAQTKKPLDKANKDEDEENKEENKGELFIIRNFVKEQKKFFKTPNSQGEVFSIVLGIEAPLAYLYYATESGSQVFLHNTSDQKCFIDSSEVKPVEYFPPKDIKRTTNANIKKLSLRRQWDFNTGKVEDMVLKKSIPFYRNTIADQTFELMSERLLKVARAIILHEKEEED